MSAVTKFELAKTMEEYLGGHMLGVLRRVERSCAFLRYCRGAGFLPAHYSSVCRGTACPFEGAHAQLESGLFRLLNLLNKSQPLVLLECQDSYEEINREVRSMAVPVPLPTFEQATRYIVRDPDCHEMMTAGGVHHALGELLTAASASMCYLNSVEQVLDKNHSGAGGGGAACIARGRCMNVVLEFLQAAERAIELMMEARDTIKDEEEE
jgi:hypothetical protein